MGGESGQDGVASRGGDVVEEKRRILKLGMIHRAAIYVIESSHFAHVQP